MFNNVKMVIVMRTDLNMRKGKMIAQGAHASMKVFFDKMRYSTEKVSIEQEDKTTKEMIFSHRAFVVLKDCPVDKWIEGKFTKVVVGVDSLEKLLALHEKAKERGIPTSLIKDAGLTEFKEPTYTCIAIGPDESEKIDEITGELKLL